MILGLLRRLSTGDEGTFGELTVGDFKCYTVELPWRNNAGGKSCVPPGNYVFYWRKDSPAHGECYEMSAEDAKRIDRTNVQIHSANLAGDEEKGYVTQLLGCIAPGTAVMTFKAGRKPAGTKDQKGVAASKTALAELERRLGKAMFGLRIEEAYNAA